MSDRKVFGAFYSSTTIYQVNILAIHNGNYVPLLPDEGGSAFSPYFSLESAPNTAYNFGLKIVQNGGVPSIQLFFTPTSTLNLAISTTTNQPFFQSVANQIYFISQDNGIPNLTTWPVSTTYTDPFQLSQTLPIVAGIDYSLYSKVGSSTNLLAFPTKTNADISASSSAYSASLYPSGPPYVPVVSSTYISDGIIIIPYGGVEAPLCSVIANNGPWAAYLGLPNPPLTTMYTNVQDCVNANTGSLNYDKCGTSNFGVCIYPNDVCATTSVANANKTNCKSFNPNAPSSKSYLWVLWVILGLLAVAVIGYLIYRSVNKRNKDLAPGDVQKGINDANIELSTINIEKVT